MTLKFLTFGLAAGLLAACGPSGETGGTQERKDRIEAGDQRLKDLQHAAEDLAALNASCMKEDAEACYKLGELYEEDGIHAGEDRKILYHYKMACDLGLQKGCDAADRLNGG